MITFTLSEMSTVRVCPGCGGLVAAYMVCSRCKPPDPVPEGDVIPPPTQLERDQWADLYDAYQSTMKKEGIRGILIRLLYEARQQLERALPFKNILIDELILAGIYRKEHETDAARALHDLIAWQTTLALDPAVSHDAEQLQNTYLERAETAEARVAVLETRVLGRTLPRNPAPKPQPTPGLGVPDLNWTVISDPGAVLTVRSAPIPADIQVRIARALDGETREST